MKIKLSEEGNEDWPLFLQNAVDLNSNFPIEIISERKLCESCEYLFYRNKKLFFKNNEQSLLNFSLLEKWNQHHRNFYALSKEPLSKALGLQKRDKITVWDTTAGTGKDSVLIAYFLSLHQKQLKKDFHWNLHLFERNPLIYLLLKDALQFLPIEIPLHFMSAHDSLINLEKPDVLYYDPMYEEHSVKNKSALPRKEMQMFREIVGSDLDSSEFLEWAINLATDRVIVKRAIHAPFLEHTHLKPIASFKGKSTRYDLYKK